MTLTYRDALANARLDLIESMTGVSAILKIRSGSAPANVATASTGTVLATSNLPADWMAAAAARSKAKSGTWEDLSADATGTAGHFEITASDGTTVWLRGTVSLSGGGGDMILDNLSFTAGQAFSVSAFTINHPA